MTTQRFGTDPSANVSQRFDSALGNDVASQRISADPALQKSERFTTNAALSRDDRFPTTVDSGAGIFGSQFFGAKYFSAKYFQVVPATNFVIGGAQTERY